MMSSGLVHYLLRHWDITFGYRSVSSATKRDDLAVATMSNPMILAGLKTGEIDMALVGCQILN